MNYKKNTIYIANSESFDVANLSTPLTAYAAGYNLPEVQSLLDFIAPSVQTPKRFEYRSFGKGQFAMEIDDVRASGADFKKVAYSGEVIDAHLLNKGLSVFIDKDDNFEGAENQAVEFLKRRLLRNELLRAFSVLQAAAGNAVAKKWMADGEGKTSPDGDVAALVASVGDSCGLDANRVVYGSQAWLFRLAALLGSTAPAEGASARMSPEEIAKFLGIDGAMIAKARGEIFESGSKKKASIGNASYVFAFNGESGLSKNDASTIKRFHSGGDMNVYRETKNNGILITVEHYSRIVQTGVGACAALSISNS